MKFEKKPKHLQRSRRLHKFRTKNNGFREEWINRKEAIKLHCTECMGWETDPKCCTSPLCPLYPFRGKTKLSLWN